MGSGGVRWCVVGWSEYNIYNIYIHIYTCMCQQVPTVPGDPCANGCQWVPTNKRVPTGADIKTANAQFAKPQMHILQSNRSVQSTAEASCLPCSVAVLVLGLGVHTAVSNAFAAAMNDQGGMSVC